MFVLKEINIGEKIDFFDLNTQEKWEIYFVFCVTEHLRHIACSVIEINMFTGFERDHYLQND